MALDLGKNVGPLPLGAWLVVVATGLGVGLWTNRGGSPQQEPEPQRETGGVPGVGTGPGWVAVPPPTTGAPSNAPEIVDNESWGRQAINALIADGYDPVMADSAIRKYLAAEKLSVSEYALIRIVLVKVGSPPVPLPPPLDSPRPQPTPTVPRPPVAVPRPRAPAPKPPAPRPAPPKVSLRYHTVTRGENLSRIAQRYYGRQDWQRLYNANRLGVRRPDGTYGMIANPNLIFPGNRIYIP